MKIYSDTLTIPDLRQALPAGVDMPICDPISRTRKRSAGWNVSLSGSSHFASQMHRGKAATWDEWGIWMARLYDIDPDALIGLYGDRDSFYDETRKVVDNMMANDYYHDTPQGRRYAETHQAPWLDEDPSNKPLRSSLTGGFND